MGAAEPQVRHDGADPPPAWSDFADPLEAISGRFAAADRLSRRRASANRSGGRCRSWASPTTQTGNQFRKRYSGLVRRYHPDKNGGDRSHESKLGEVIDAYQLLRKSAAFA